MPSELTARPSSSLPTNTTPVLEVSPRYTRRNEWRAFTVSALRNGGTRRYHYDEKAKAEENKQEKKGENRASAGGHTSLLTIINMIAIVLK